MHVYTRATWHGRGVPTHAKKHHYVPQFLLNRFALDGQIVTVRLPGDVRYPSAVVDTGMENHFHTIPGHPTDPVALEVAFGGVEDAVAPLLEDVEAGVWPLAADDRVTVAVFLVLQALRGPDQRRLMVTLQDQMVTRETQRVAEDGAARWFADHGVQIDEERARGLFETVANRSEPLLKIDAEFHAAQIARQTERVLPRFLACRWTLVRFDTPSLIVSDAPVSIADVSDGHRGSRGLLTTPTITVPLSRRTALVMGEAPPTRPRITVAAVVSGAHDKEVTGSAVSARYFNGRTVFNAARALYHHPDDAALVPTDLPNPRD